MPLTNVSDQYIDGQCLMCYPLTRYAVTTVCRLCRYCSLHCRCRVCDECSTLNVVYHYCSECGRCSNGDRTCCECNICSECDIRIPLNSNTRYCNDCDSCGNCCECESGVTEYPGPGDPVFWTASPEQLVRNPSTRYAALEIEVSSTSNNGYAPNLNQVLYSWHGKLVRDGSIEGGNFEQEINTAPASGDLLIKQLHEIGEALKTDGASANKTCGVHCHVDCRDFTFYDMRRLILLYEKIEDALFSMVHKRRRESEWCHPCGERYADAIRAGSMPHDDDATKKAIVGNLYGSSTARDNKTINKTIRKAKQHKYDSVRYSALNLHSWIYRGTVECRIHHGSVSESVLTNWALLWVSIVDYAYKATEAEIEALDGSPVDILTGIAPSLAGWISGRIARFR